VVDHGASRDVTTLTNCGAKRISDELYRSDPQAPQRGTKSMVSIQFSQQRLRGLGTHLEDPRSDRPGFSWRLHWALPGL
jgi:hypothetical protein